MYERIQRITDPVTVPFLAPTEAQGVTMSFRPSVRPALSCQKHAIFIVHLSSSDLHFTSKP